MTRPAETATVSSGLAQLPRRARALLRLAALILLPLGLLLAGAAPAAAHSALVSSEPGAGYALTSPPADITLNFSERVTLPDRALVVLDTEAKPRPLRVSLDPGRKTVRCVPTTELPVGAYQVSYRVIGRDGDLISGTFWFGVATPVHLLTRQYRFPAPG